MRRSFGCVLWVIACVIGQQASLANACSQWSLAPHTQWQVAMRQNVSWLLTPCGEPFFSIGINALNDGYPSRLYKGRLSYHWHTFYADFHAWQAVTRQRVVSWGFNTAGGWSLHPNILALPILPNLELGRQAAFHWFDPFRPSMEQEMRAMAHQLVAPYKGNPYRMGYFSDNEVGWWYGALFTFYLKQPATNHTKQKLLAVLQETYENDWQQFVRDFVPPPDVSSFAALLNSSGTITQLRPGGQGIHVVRRWTGMVAEHYYRLVHSTLREADPEALIFAERLQIYYDAAAIRTMTPYVDVIATNYDVDTPDGWIARYYFDGLQQLTGNKPILISEWFFAARENRSGNRNNGHLMTVSTQAERARGAAAAAQQFALHPRIVGIHWFQYYDHPEGGRPDGEDYNFGLVDIHDRPYEELVEAFSRVNPGLAEIHQQTPRTLPMRHEGLWDIPEAHIDARDLSLADWPKEQAFLPGLFAPAPEVVFGDFYLAWNDAGLYLATISMDYYDPILLAFDGDTVPLEETFRIDWGIDAGSGPQHFAIFIVPPKVYAKTGPPLTRTVLCRAEAPPCVSVLDAVTSYFGGDTPRIVAEVFLPWSALGMAGPPADKQLRVELAATAYHRARWMSWSGIAPQLGAQDTTRWHTVRLTPRR